ncbi:MAG: universal stress protein [Acidimicrobiia bacterium]
MHVLIATDGSINTDQAAAFAGSLAGDEGTTSVLTVVRVPRRMVQELRHSYGDQAPVRVDSDAEYVGSPQAGGNLERGFPGDDALVEQYLGDKRIERCRPVAEAIRAMGGSAESVVREGDEVEDIIMATADELGADVIVVGAHGKHAFQGLLGSTGAKLVRRSSVPVLVLR